MDDIMASLQKIAFINDCLKERYKWSSDLLGRCFAALTFALSGREFDIEKFDGLKGYIKDNTKLFSHYRSRELIMYPALLITKFDNPEHSFRDLLMYEDKLHKAGFMRSPNLGIAAYAMLITSTYNQVEQRIKRASEIYTGMKKAHAWLTGQDDYPLAVLLSSIDNDTQILLNNIETSFSLLHEKGFTKSGGLQFLSHLLTFSSEPVETKVERCIKILEYFKEHKIRIYSEQYAILGLIALTGEDCGKVMEQAISLFQETKRMHGLKWLDRGTMLLISCSLSCNSYFKDYIQRTGILETSLNISIQAIIAAQNAAMIGAAVAASTAVSSTSASS